MKKYKCSLTLRVFWLTFAFSVLACAITYGAIAGLTPLSYTALLKEELDAQAEVFATVAVSPTARRFGMMTP